MVFSQNRSTSTWAYSYCKRVASFIALYQTIALIDVPRLTTITVILFVHIFIVRFRYLAMSPSGLVPVILLYSKVIYYHYQSKHSLSTGKLHVYLTSPYKAQLVCIYLISVYNHLKHGL